MPCRVDIEEPTSKQLRNQKTAKCLIYVYEKLEIAQSPQLVSDSANRYLNTDWAPDLCSLLRSLPDDQLEALVYNAKDKGARALADWWEEHQEVDRKRAQLAKEQAELEAFRAAALAKLTPEEQQAVLGIR